MSVEKETTVKKANVLIIDDEDRFRELLGRIISLEGFKVYKAATAGEGFNLLESNHIQVVITDVKLPDMNGLEVLSRIKKQDDSVEVIVITAYGSIQDGVQAMKVGAFDYITKGDEDEQIHVVVDRAAEKARLRQRIQNLERQVEQRFTFDNIIGTSTAIEQTKNMARKVAPTEAVVLLQGETGTGKELFAQAIHQHSPRQNQPFVALNCSAFPRDLLESELFGFKKGAFTNADHDKKGLIEEADQGTLFLDEIGEMQPELQTKLLRFLETQQFLRLGDTTPRGVNVRIIAASNRNLEQEIKDEHFRADLFYRLSAFKIEIPPLRNRLEDLEDLVPYFIRFYAEKTKKKVNDIEEEAYHYLERYDWPGNIRELRNVIERSVILAEGRDITSDLLPPEFFKSERSPLGHPRQTLKELEKQHIQRVLDYVGWNKAQAAELLEIGISTLYRKIDEYELSPTQ